jgi:hypothetical protein
MKLFRLKYNIGKAKYVVSYHDGIKTHKDGSPFFDIEIFKSQKKCNTFIAELRTQGYNQD